MYYAFSSKLFFRRINVTKIITLTLRNVFWDPAKLPNPKMRFCKEEMLLRKPYIFEEILRQRLVLSEHITQVIAKSTKL